MNSKASNSPWEGLVCPFTTSITLINFSRLTSFELESLLCSHLEVHHPGGCLSLFKLFPHHVFLSLAHFTLSLKTDQDIRDMLRKLQQLWVLQEQNWHPGSFIIPQLIELFWSLQHQPKSRILQLNTMLCLAQILDSTFATSQEQGLLLLPSFRAVL